MNEHEPTSTRLRDLRRAHLRQQYDGDLGALIDPARRRSIWPPLAAAALLAVCVLVGWQAAVQLRQARPVARQTQPVQPAPIDDLPRLRTLENPAPAAVTREALPGPSETVAAEAVLERRPVLPGLLVMSSSRATPPPRPSFAPRPNLSLIQSSITSENEQGSLP